LKLLKGGTRTLARIFPVGHANSKTFPSNLGEKRYLLQKKYALTCEVNSLKQGHDMI